MVSVHTVWRLVVRRAIALLEEKKQSTSRPIESEEDLLPIMAAYQQLLARIRSGEDLPEVLPPLIELAATAVIVACSMPASVATTRELRSSGKNK
jgi:hypothetical protein